MNAVSTYLISLLCTTRSDSLLHKPTFRLGPLDMFFLLIVTETKQKEAPKDMTEECGKHSYERREKDQETMKQAKENITKLIESVEVSSLNAEK